MLLGITTNYKKLMPKGIHCFYGVFVLWSFLTLLGWLGWKVFAPSLHEGNTYFNCSLFVSIHYFPCIFCLQYMATCQKEMIIFSWEQPSVKQKYQNKWLDDEAKRYNIVWDKQLAVVIYVKRSNLPKIKQYVVWTCI